MGSRVRSLVEATLSSTWFKVVLFLVAVPPPAGLSTCSYAVSEWVLPGAALVIGFLVCKAIVWKKRPHVETAAHDPWFIMVLLLVASHGIMISSFICLGFFLLLAPYGYPPAAVPGVGLHHLPGGVSSGAGSRRAVPSEKSLARGTADPHWLSYRDGLSLRLHHLSGHCFAAASDTFCAALSVQRHRVHGWSPPEERTRRWWKTREKCLAFASAAPHDLSPAAFCRNFFP